jgi:hypothetical protein
MRQLWPKRRASLAGAAALGLGLVLLCVPAGAAAAPASPRAANRTWTIQPSPDKHGAVASALAAVSCVKNGPCEAVGTYTLATGLPRHQFALILRGSGGTWTLQPTPTIKGVGYSLLSGVSCTSADSCLAVGYTVSHKKNAFVDPLAERWNGTTWAVDSPPEPGGPHAWAVLDDVSCPDAAFCLAVGGYIKNLNADQQEQPLAEEWNGTSWTQLTAPNPHAENGSELTSVSCVSARACEIDGDYAYADVAESVFAYGYNGTSFTAQKQVNPSGQEFNAGNSVSCTTASACTSAGIWTPLGTLGLAERWNGTAWSRQSLPKPPKTVTDGLTGVSCTAAASCTAVGDFTTSNGNNPPSTPLAMTWNGTSWRLATTTDPTGGGGLNSVSCTTPSTCVAVGAAGTSTLVEVSPAG